jgi:hopanoid C-3 methylase
MRILLVKPRAQLSTILGLQRFTMLEPLELGYLAASVPPEHEVRVLDLRLARFPGQTFRATLRSFQPDLVGITGYSHEASTVKGLARVTRRELPNARVVVGGHHATVAPEDYATGQIDAVVRGEGCVPFAAILARLATGEGLSGIPNVVIPDDGASGGADSGWPQFPDPATLPTPRRDLWDARAYTSVWVCESPAPWHALFPPVAMVRSSFGCKMKCSFCVVPYLSGGRHLPRPVEAVVEEIAGLRAEHVYFCDDENFIDEAFASELAEKLAARGVRKRYFAWARSTTVNRSPELLRAWREIGLDAVFLGFEFSSDDELRTAAKGGSVAANERALATLRSLGIAAHAAFMITPEYTRDDFDRLHDYVQALPPAQCSFTVCTPSPGTPDYDEIRPRIWVQNPYDLHDCMHPLTPTTLPLREFSRLYARQVAEGIAKTPLRRASRPVHPWHLARATLARAAYRRSYENLYRDYPRELWG